MQAATDGGAEPVSQDSGPISKETFMATTVPYPKHSTPGVAGYHAAVVHDFSGPLSVEQVPWRKLQPGQILVQVEASGLCHTDIHAAHGDWPIKPSPPFIPGHEGVGIVQELGPGVTEVACGDRVAMPWLGYACGTSTDAGRCGYVSGRASASRTGSDRDFGR
jgi:threonine dehydrogenase-like Zn-dependent dehydrogenase